MATHNDKATHNDRATHNDKTTHNDNATHGDKQGSFLVVVGRHLWRLPLPVRRAHISSQMRRAYSLS